MNKDWININKTFYIIHRYRELAGSATSFSQLRHNTLYSDPFRYGNIYDTFNVRSFKFHYITKGRELFVFEVRGYWQNDCEVLEYFTVNYPLKKLIHANYMSGYDDNISEYLFMIYTSIYPEVKYI